MAVLSRNVMVVLAVLAAVYSAVHAQPCPAVTNYLACRAAVTESNVTPDMACCSELATVMKQANGAQCLCDAMTSPAATTFKVIKSEAVMLPSKCEHLMGLQYIHNYDCKGVKVP